MNHTYFVSADDKKYVLRIYSHNKRSYNDISEEVRLLNLLKANAISVSSPIADKNGDFVKELNAPEGLRYAVLFSFGEGHKERFLNEEFCFNIGRLTAQMHAATPGDKLNRATYDINTLAAQAYNHANKYFSESLEEMQYIKSGIKLLNAKFNHNNVRSGIVHLDIWYDNMSITDEGEIKLFDFDNCGNGWLVLDIGYFCMQLFHIEADKAVYESKKSKFLEGYESITPISKEEIALIPYAGMAIWIYYLGLQSERFDNFANIFLTENYLKMYIGRLKEWMKYNGEDR